MIVWRVTSVTVPEAVILTGRGFPSVSMVTANRWLPDASVVAVKNSEMPPPKLLPKLPPKSCSNANSLNENHHGTHTPKVYSGQFGGE